MIEDVFVIVAVCCCLFLFVMITHDPRDKR